MAIEIVSPAAKPEGWCGVCDAPDCSYGLERDEQKIAPLCGDCIRAGRDVTALRARRRSRELYRQGAALLGIAAMLEEAGDWPIEEWGRG